MTERGIPKRKHRPTARQGSVGPCSIVSIFLVGFCMALSPVRSARAESDLKAYAASIISDMPFRNRPAGYGVWLAGGFVVTASHVIGHWAGLTGVTVLIDGQKVSGRVIKKGSFPDLDLALLSVDDTALPLRVRLRVNPLCNVIPDVGYGVDVVYPDREVRSHIISAKSILPAYRARFPTLIDEPQGSGSGLFDPTHNCLLGIMSASIATVTRTPQTKRAGYFVAAETIFKFVSQEVGDLISLIKP